MFCPSCIRVLYIFLVLYIWLEIVWDKMSLLLCGAFIGHQKRFLHCSFFSLVAFHCLYCCGGDFSSRAIGRSIHSTNEIREWCVCVAGTQRESVTCIRKENITRIRAKPQYRKIIQYTPLFQYQLSIKILAKRVSHHGRYGNKDK